MNVQIESRNVGMTPRWKTEIEKRMDDLQFTNQDITHARVTLNKNAHHKKTDNVAEVVIVISLPGRHTFTARKEDKTFEEAIRAAFFSMDLELSKFVEKRAAKEIRLSPLPLRGVICKLFPQEGYGFLLQEGGGEVYFHRNAVHGIPFEELKDGLEVAFNEEPGEKGPQATTVNPIPVLP